MSYVLGLSFSHNGSVSLANENSIISIQEERLNRIKRFRLTGNAAMNSLAYCMNSAGISVKDIGQVVYSVQGDATDYLNRYELNKELYNLSLHVPFVNISHHLAHAASAFFGSEFKDALIIVVDGMGSPYTDLSAEEKKACHAKSITGWEHASIYVGEGRKIYPYHKLLIRDGKWVDESKEGMPLYASVGGMYSAVAKQIFGGLMDCGKVMGLAPYGHIDYQPEAFLEYENGRFVFKSDIPSQFINNKRWPGEQTVYKNLAASVQNAMNKQLFRYIEKAIGETKKRNVCLAGGVFLNCIFNEILYNEFNCINFYIPPAPDDSGASVGAAYYGINCGSKSKCPPFSVEMGVPYQFNAAVRTEMLAIERNSDYSGLTASLLAQGKYVGWFQGGSELGPRALGHRSILASPAIKNAKEIINNSIKFREDFRPFAPSIIEEEVSNWFDVSRTSDHKSPFMHRAFLVLGSKVDKINSVVHIDGTSRLQTVSAAQNPVYYKLLKSFYELTDIPLLLNTSFNTIGEPIIETPEDAVMCFLFANLDACVINDMILQKNDGYSVMNLTPALNISSCRVSYRIKNGSGIDVQDIERVDISTNSQRKEEAQKVDRLFYLLLRFVDEHRNGWEIFTEMEKRLNLDINQFHLVYREAAKKHLIVFKEIDIATKSGRRLARV